MPTPPLPPATSRLVGFLLMLSGFLLGLGLLLRVGVSVYGWYAGAPAGSSAMFLSVNLLGLLGSGLLMRGGLQMRRGNASPHDPNADEIL
jgi:hypothetical protein